MLPPPPRPPRAHAPARCRLKYMPPPVLGPQEMLSGRYSTPVRDLVGVMGDGAVSYFMGLSKADLKSECAMNSLAIGGTNNKLVERLLKKALDDK